ncbi:MAG: helix-turn-helix domain-containing protein [Treponema sp.]|uniref:helix-turn-helix domain-containing protein n=1 Tax=Treponema sp. TaxID=166 RepID=UPI00298E2DCE|nr:helix-turn-helix transcriptional regulator [Treponema sp.]MCQ2600616.1 helix-turn-helix domain-containing protein [Treponema sp.]
MTSNDIQIRLAENLKRIRKNQKLTQFQLAEKAGISDETVKNIELCKTWTSEKTLAQITDVLNIDVSMLFLPVSSSFEKDSEATAQIKNVIGENIVKYVNTVLEEVYSNK